MSNPEDTTVTDNATTPDRPVQNGMRPEDYALIEQDRRRASMLAQQQTDAAQREQLNSSAAFLYLIALFMGIADDDALNSDEALAELASALGLEEDVFRNTVTRVRSGEMTFAEAARSSFRSSSGGSVSESEIAAANNAISRYASSDNPLLEVIAAKESNGNYNIVYGGRNVNLTGMTINQVLAWQDNFVDNGSPSSAAGKYQIIRKTLRGLKESMGLSGNELFDEEMQDRMAIKLLEGRGYNDYLAGKIDDATFMRRISQEWASMPKDAGGRSYYAGDGLNKAHETPENLIAAMRLTRQYELNGGPPTETPTAVAAVASAGGMSADLPSVAVAFGEGEGIDGTLATINPMTDGVSAAFTLDVNTNGGTDQVSLASLSDTDLSVSDPALDTGIKPA